MSRGVVLSIIPVTTAVLAAAAVLGADIGSFLTSIEEGYKKAAAIAVDDYREKGCPNSGDAPFTVTAYYAARDKLGFFTDVGSLIVDIRRNPDSTFNAIGKADEFEITKRRKGLAALEKRVPDYREPHLKIPGCG